MELLNCEKVRTFLTILVVLIICKMSYIECFRCCYDNLIVDSTQNTYVRIADCSVKFNVLYINVADINCALCSVS